jgi:hypothetical protein
MAASKPTFLPHLYLNTLPGFTTPASYATTATLRQRALGFEQVALR